jgi:hypothetical protein
MRKDTSMTPTCRWIGLLTCALVLHGCSQPAQPTPEQRALRELAHKPLDLSQPYIAKGEMIDYRTWYPSTIPQEAPAPRPDGTCPYYTPTNAMDGTPDCAYAKKAMEGLRDKP